MSYYIKIGFRYLGRRKIRTILTIIAILLGVSILMGTLVANDSIKGTLEYQITEKFGFTDILILNESYSYKNTINFNEIKENLDNISYLGFTWTAQMKESRSVAFEKNVSTAQSLWLPIIGVDTSNPFDEYFGKITINQSIAPEFNSLKKMLLYPAKNCCVINIRIAELYNLSINDTIYIYPEAPWIGIDSTNSSTWVNLTITGIILDEGKALQYINPPVENIWEIRDINYAIYVNMSLAHEYLTNSDNQLKVNNIAIHSNSIHQINSVLDSMMQYLNSSLPSNTLYGFNLKSLFENEINNVFSLMMAILIIFSGISFVICAVLIKNLFEVAVEEQMEEIGIMRAIGVSRGGIFAIYITQISIISVIGSILGLILGYFISTFFFTSIQYASNVLNPLLYDLLEPSSIIITVTYQTILISFLSGVIISLIFGLLPAYKASVKQIIYALNPRLERGEDS